MNRVPHMLAAQHHMTYHPHHHATKKSDKQEEEFVSPWLVVGCIIFDIVYILISNIYIYS